MFINNLKNGNEEKPLTATKINSSNVQIIKHDLELVVDILDDDTILEYVNHRFTLLESSNKKSFLGSPVVQMFSYFIG